MRFELARMELCAGVLLELLCFFIGRIRSWSIVARLVRVNPVEKCFYVTNFVLCRVVAGAI